MRAFSLLDRFLIEVDQALRTIYGVPVGGRVSPAEAIDPNEDVMPEPARRLSGRLLRVDHAGEISAQGLYQGQALTAHNPCIREQMRRSATEENDHLAWCDQRIHELGTHKSWLRPFWYMGSYMLGAAAGLAGDRWSLGFLAETERQVVKHLEEHTQRLPAGDKKSLAVLAQMKIDEAHHANTANGAGAQELPRSIKRLMTLMSKVMTRTAYWV
jgi:ubiquinone biosynthesis monooxygenase Coq7